MTTSRRPGRLALVGGIALSLGLAGIAAAWATARRRPDHDRDRDPLLALHRGSPDGPGRRARHRSSCATTTRSTTSGSSATPAIHERHRTGTEPVHGSRPTEVIGPGRVEPDDDHHVRHARHVPVHLPPARARGVRDDRHAGRDRRLNPPPTRRLSSGGCAHCPAPFDEIAAGRPAAIALAGPALLGSRLLTKDLAFTDRRARRVPAARPAAGSGPDDRGAGRARARAPPAQGRRARAVHRPGRPPGPQRDALLPAAGRAPRGVPADRLHADGRAGLPGVQPHHPADARHLDHPGRCRPDPGSSCARARTTTSGSSSSPTTSGSSGSATRAPAGWRSRSASWRCTRRRAASTRP